MHYYINDGGQKKKMKIDIRRPCTCKAEDEQACADNHHLTRISIHENESNCGICSHVPIFLCVWGSFAVPAAANTKSQKDCHIPPIMRGFLRPYYQKEIFSQILLMFVLKKAWTFSMIYNPRNVHTKFTAPRMIWVTKESAMPTETKMVAP